MQYNLKPLIVVMAIALAVFVLAKPFVLRFTAPEDYARWLDRSATAVTDLIAPYPADALRVHPISSLVNAVKNDDAALLERVDEAPAEEGPESVPDDSEMPEQPELF